MSNDTPKQTAPRNLAAQVAHALPVLTGYIDSQHIYRFVNQCHEHWFGTPIDTIEGKHVSDILGFAGYETVLPHIEAALSGKHAEFEMQMQHCKSGIITVKTCYIPDRDANGKIPGFSFVAQDITKLKHQAETAIYAKNAFLATMSHEIRTPLNGILGMTELLLNTELNERQLKYATTVCRSGEGLLEIINDILDFCKIEAGEMDIEATFFNLQDIANKVIRSLTAKAAEKGNELKLNIAVGTPAHAVGDPARIKQLLTNLVSNAIKFTNNGPITLYIKHQNRNEKGVTFLFEVKDSGIGIAPDKIDTIFDKFSQVDGSNTRKFGGTGLGLAICHKLVKLMGGKIGVESTVGKGSTFWFSLSLPAEEVVLSTLQNNEGHAPQPANTQPKEKKRWAAFKGVHILLAEDDPSNQQMAMSMLEAMKCRVSMASNGKEAVRLIGQEHSFDLVLMDCEMPEMNGYEATSIIKQTTNIPIIALTASVMRGDKDRCFAAGMDDYIPKPVKHKELEKKLIKWIAEEKLAKVS